MWGNHRMSVKQPHFLTFSFNLERNTTVLILPYKKHDRSNRTAKLKNLQNLQGFQQLNILPVLLQMLYYHWQINQWSPSAPMTAWIFYTIASVTASFIFINGYGRCLSPQFSLIHCDIIFYIYFLVLFWAHKGYHSWCLYFISLPLRRKQTCCNATILLADTKKVKFSDQYETTDLKILFVRLVEAFIDLSKE